MSGSNGKDRYSFENIPISKKTRDSLSGNDINLLASIGRLMYNQDEYITDQIKGVLLLLIEQQKTIQSVLDDIKQLTLDVKDLKNDIKNVQKDVAQVMEDNAATKKSMDQLSRRVGSVEQEVGKIKGVLMKKGIWDCE